ncbi:1,4-alpha-glucan branching protein GlgB [Rhodospirillum centenum]|uniref:1,4-alpha-glucan branching enzyme GlgB n=1 Tax=Rhodospirillum centenum (strain ATCC 51521 / SW) TaxID=414684 RepID=B6ITC6_RHOCS|nr:1,4-alpha-glucan branching protein GlgB [Rhodospirillum centenum]ACI99144.1 1,4-alpha-glucan branching enzyme [Rhodospirillum centenum SW]
MAPRTDVIAHDVIAAVTAGTHADPFAVLGLHPHPGGKGGLVLRVFRPDADAVTVLTPDGEELGVMPRRHESGFFEMRFARQERFAYRLRIDRGGTCREIDDPYRFPPILGEMDQYLLAEGRHWRAWEALGAHPTTVEGVAGVRFAVWAPNAERVSVVGDFNDWDGRINPMRLRLGAGIWEIFIPGLEEGAVYKYEIIGPGGELLPLKADPFGFQGEMRPNTASVVARIDRHTWHDQEWMATRAARHDRSAPVSIYEVHLGSWMRWEDGGFLSYGELARRLVPYVRDMGFTHIEVMPVHEHPFDGSWGYQPLGLYAPTSRFGTPSDFQSFVDACHQEGLGLLIDWVPGHFPNDAHGLYRFDGTHLFEHSDPRQGYHPDWNTAIYNFGRTEVANFLTANALYWLKAYHVDGLRVDAVASMLYLDYSRQAGQWVPNRFGGRENLEAIDFLRRMNELVYGSDEGQGGSAVTVAEESTAWPGVSRPTYVGGLGFGYKWNMGWMHDTLRYMKRDPIHRRFHHDDLTFGLLYAFSENFILPLSHDEVVHGKGSLLARMPGDTWQQFANLRAYYGFMWTHPGKKLLFMGGEFAQGREWNHDAGLDWHLLDVHWHRGVRDLVRDLNWLYRETPALHELDCESDGFRWIRGQSADDSLLAYARFGRQPGSAAAVVCNFTPVPRPRYRIGLPAGGVWREALNTDSALYGGTNIGNGGRIEAESVPWDGQPFSAEVEVPPLATVIFVKPPA